MYPSQQKMFTEFLGNNYEIYLHFICEIQLNCNFIKQPGGTEVGWTPVSSVILWNRVLGILGNVNDIQDQEMHGLVFQHLIYLWELLETVS